METSLIKILRALWLGEQDESVNNLISKMEKYKLSYSMVYFISFFTLGLPMTIKDGQFFFSGALIAFDGGLFGFMTKEFYGLLVFKSTCMSCQRSVLKETQFNFLPIFPDRRYSYKGGSNY